MEKQIEEMANIIDRNINGANFDDVSDAAVAIYRAGYRKQSVGEWVRGKTNYRTLFCSKCGYPKPYRKIKAGYHLLDDASYCPNCGAYMKGESNG